MIPSPIYSVTIIHLHIRENIKIITPETGSTEVSTVSPLHTNLQVPNFQRCDRAFHRRQAWVQLQLALRLLLLTILQLYHLPTPLPPPVSNSSCLFTRCQPLYASCCTVLFKVLYCKIKNVFFTFCVCLFFMYYLCEKYYKPITVQYYIADCDRWLPRLTLLALRTKWT